MAYAISQNTLVSTHDGIVTLRRSLIGVRGKKYRGKLQWKFVASWRRRGFTPFVSRFYTIFTPGGRSISSTSYPSGASMKINRLPDDVVVGPSVTRMPFLFKFAMASSRFST